MADASGEIVRVRHALDRLRTQLNGLALVIVEAEDGRIPPGVEASQALVSTTFEIVCGLAKVDALLRSAGSRHAD